MSQKPKKNCQSCALLAGCDKRLKSINDLYDSYNGRIEGTSFHQEANEMGGDCDEHIPSIIKQVWRKFRKKKISPMTGYVMPDVFC